MARISKENIEKIEKNRNRVHDKVACTYSVFTDEYGNKMFQIDTYGSKTRECKGKISQSIQFDKQTALELIKILTKEYNL